MTLCDQLRRSGVPTGLDWVCPLRGLTGQHYAVGAVKHSVSNITDLSPRGPGIILFINCMNAKRLGNTVGLLTVMDYRKLGKYGMNFSMQLHTSNICVATMTGLPAMLHLAIIIF
jgi:hypothetical protein